MSPERIQPPNQEALRQEAVQKTYEAARAHEDVSHMQILPGAKAELDVNQKFEVSATKEGLGSQKLLAFVRSGDVMYSVTSFESADNPGGPGFVLNEVGTPGNPNDRATMLGVCSEGLPLGVGVSGKEGLLRLENDGKIAVEATGDHNIELLYPAQRQETAEHSEADIPKEPTAERTAFGGLRRTLKKFGGSPEVPATEPINLSEFHVWAPKSQIVATAVTKSFNERAMRDKALSPDRFTSEPKATPAELEEARLAAQQARAGSSPSPELRYESPTPPELITGAPSPEGLRDQKEAEAEAAEQELQNKLDDLVEGLGEDDRRSVWQYAAELVKKREAQFRDDGEGSIMHEQNAGQARRALSPDGLEVVDKYYNVYVRMQNLRAARLKKR